MAQPGEPGESPAEPRAGRGARPAASRRRPARTRAASVPRSRRMTQSAAPASTHSTAIHSASRSTIVDREQPAEPGAGQGERVPAVARWPAARRHRRRARTRNSAETEVVEGQHQRRRGRRSPTAPRRTASVRGRPALGPEAAEEVVEQRARGDGHGLPGSRRAAGTGAGTGGGHGDLRGAGRGRGGSVGWGEGELDAHAGLPGRVPDLGVDEADRAAVQVGDPAGDGEPEAGPAAALGAR